MTQQELITLHEGRKRKPYKCPAGHLSIGIGHNIDANGLPPDIKAYLDYCGEITDDMIDRLYRMDEYNAERQCEKLWRNWERISHVRQMALIDFMFNVGPGTAEGFIAANAAIELEDWEGAAHCLEDSRWYRQVGRRGRRIVKMIRTNREAL